MIRNERHRFARELVLIARELVAWRDKHHQPVRREKSVLDQQVSEGIDEYFDDGDEGLDNSDFMRIRNVKDEREAYVIQEQYEQAMSRDHDYLGDVFGWSLDPTTQIVESVDGDYVVGFRCGSSFILSHFAPKTLSSGMRFVTELANWSQSIIAAVLPKQANMLERLGFKKVGTIPQWFNGETVMKTVMVNGATTEATLVHVLSKGTGKSYLVIYLSTPELFSAEYVADEIKGNESMQDDFLEVVRNYKDYRLFIPAIRLIYVVSCLNSTMRKTRFLKECVDAMEEKFASNFQWKLLKSRGLRI